MASYLDKFKIKTAVDTRSKLDLSCQHISTADFMQLSPIYIKEMVPNEKISINCESFARVAPMPVPTFGRMNINNRAFFVPFRTIFRGWNDFITDTKHVTGDEHATIQSTVPNFYMNTWAEALFSTVTSDPTDGFFGTIQEVPITASTLSSYTYDYSCIYGNQGDGYGYKLITLNANGRQLMKIMQSLGYQYCSSVNIEEQYTSWDTFKFSALPLLAYLKVYLDWYFPSAYYDSIMRTTLEGYLNIDTLNPKSFNANELLNIFQNIIRVNYDSDYFVSAFENPVAGATGSYSSVAIEDFTFNGTPYGGLYPGNSEISNLQGSEGTPTLRNAYNRYGTQASNVTSITQFGIDALKSLTDYMKRHQLVGARALDRYLARFGVNLRSDKLNRSIYIGSKNIPLQIGDIMSQAGTDNNVLGSYAGKGLAYGDSSFDYDTDEFGYVIIMSSIVPTIGYYQGIDRNVMHQSRLDFYTPEFDQLGNQAIASYELYVPSEDATAQISQGLESQVFGFTPRYAEYKIGRDKLTGDFRLQTHEAGDTSDSWHLMREFSSDSFADDASNVVISKSFVEGKDAGQYNRMFYNTDSTADHFYMIHNFNVASYSPMKSLYDTYEFDSEGKDMTIDVNGVKVN